jgi:hypothetical protein
VLIARPCHATPCPCHCSLRTAQTTSLTGRPSLRLPPSTCTCTACRHCCCCISNASPLLDLLSSTTSVQGLPKCTRRVYAVVMVLPATRSNGMRRTLPCHACARVQAYFLRPAAAAAAARGGRRLPRRPTARPWGGLRYVHAGCHRLASRQACYRCANILAQGACFAAGLGRML